MIKANELRIGNWLMNNQNNNYFPVTSIEFEWFYNIRYENISHSLEQCSPIPLTPEILKAIGATKLDPYNTWSVGKIGIGLKEEKFYYDHSKGDLKYLHQLQNLYFALTGNELKINL